MRRILIVVGVVLVVLAAVVGIALTNLNSYLNRNKDWLAEQVESSLGRKVSFSEIGVSLSGGFGARIQDLKVADDPAFSSKNFVEAGDVQVSVKIWPALFRRFEVKRIVLDKPEVWIVQTKEGMNYESIGKPKGGEEKKPAEATQAGAATEPAAFLVSLVEIQGGEFHFLDKTTSPPTDVAVRDLDFSASDVSLTSPIRLEVAVALFGADEQNVHVEGTVGPVGSPPDAQKIPVDVSLELGPIVIDEMKKLPAIAKALPPELSSPDPVTLEAKAVGTAAKLKIDGTFDATGASLLYGKTFTKPKGVPMKVALAAERAESTIDVKSLALQLAELSLTGKGTVVQGGAIDFQIDSEPTPLAGWDRLLPAFAGHQVSGRVEVHLRAKGTTAGGATPDLNGTIALTDVSAKQQGSPYEIDDLSTRLDLKGKSIGLPPTKFKLSGSPVELQVQVAALRPLAASFALQSPELKAGSLNVASPQARKPEVLRGIDLKGTLRMAEKGPVFQGTLRSSDGSLRDFDYQGLAADLDLKDQIATLGKLSLRAFDGQYDGGGRYDMRDPNVPKFDFRSTIREMDLKSLLATQSPGAEKRIEGRLDADLALSGSGKGWETIQKTLDGNGRVDVKDGVLRDVNLADEVLASVAGIGGLSKLISPRVRNRYPAVFGTGDTKFDELGGSVQVANGVARSDDLTLAARDYAMLGKGTFALDNQVDFTATLVASKQLSDDIISDVREAQYITDEEGKLQIPFRLTGSLPRVKPKPDGEFIVKALSRAAIGKGLEKIFGKEKPSPAPGETPAPSKHPERDLLKKGLEGLLKPR